VWRQKGYGSSGYKSVVNERGYDLRTREGRAQHAQRQTNNFIAGLCVFFSFGAAWLFDSAYGLWAGYVLFWIIIAFTNGVGTFVWAICAHVGGVLGYLISKLVAARPEELILWGIVFGTLLSAWVMRTVIQTIFCLSLFIGIWAIFDEPSSYFSAIPDRLLSVTLSQSPTELFAWLSEKTLPFIVSTSFAIANALSSLALLYGLWLWGWLIFNKINAWKINFVLKFLAKIIGAILVIISLPLTMVTGLLFKTLTGFGDFSSDPVSTFTSDLDFYFILVGFSATIGIFVNRAILFDRDIHLNYFVTTLMCLPGAFWLPRFMIQSSHRYDLKGAPEKGGTFAKQTQKKDKINSKSINFRRSENKNVSEAESPVRSYYKTALASVAKRIENLQKSRLKELVGLGEKRLTSIYNSYPDLSHILDDSDSNFKSKTGLGRLLAARVKSALKEIEKNRNREVLREFLQLLFPTKKAKVEIALSQFSSFEELLEEIDKNKLEIDGLTTNDLETIKRVSRIQMLNSSK